MWIVCNITYRITYAQRGRPVCNLLSSLEVPTGSVITAEMMHCFNEIKRRTNGLVFRLAVSMKFDEMLSYSCSLYINPDS